MEGTADHTSKSPGADGLTIAYGLSRLLQDLADRRPLLVCVDDAQWADLPSLRALAFVARRLGGLPVVMAFSARTPVEGPVGDLLGRVAWVPGGRRLTLGPLGEQAVATLAESTLPSGPDPALCHRLWHATGGNPFLVREVLSNLTAGGMDGELVVPESIGQAVLRRIAAAGAAAVQLADAVAVLGDAPLHQAARLAALDDPDAVTAADRLVAADILATGAALRFAHPILRQAVRSQMPPARRALAHAQAARLLADLGAPLERVAAQLLEGLPRADPWVVDTLLAAAAREQLRGSPETMVAVLTRALAEPPPAELRSQVTLALAQAQGRCGHRDAVSTAREALTCAAGPLEEAEATLQLVRALGNTGDIWSALDLLHAPTTAGTGPDPELALRVEAELLGVARLHAHTREEALTRLDRLAPRALPPRPASVVLLANLALSALERNAPAARVAELASLALSEGWLIGDHSFQLVYAGTALIWVEEFDHAARLFDDALEAGRRQGSLTLSLIGHGLRSQLCLRRGAVADAEADARIVHGLCPGVGSLPFARAHLADALIERGQWDEASRVLEDPEPGEHAEDNPFYLDSRGRLRLAQEDATGAVDDFLDCGLALTRRGGADVPSMFPWRSQAALALLQLGEEHRAHELANEELGLARKSGIASSVGGALITIGLIEGGEDGVRRLHDAVDFLQASPRVLLHARGLIELGSMLRRNRQPRLGRGFLATALDLAYRHGAIALADRAREELIIAGGRPRRAATTGLDALTPSERRIAQLVAQGLTNRQIAGRLFVSARTVATHLTHLYQKLAVDNRAELSALLADSF